MANPIARRGEDQPIGRLSEETLRNWCWEQNKRAKEAGWLHWLYVSKDKGTGAMVTKARGGSDAKDVLKVIEGWYPDFINWSADRLDAEFRILRMMARMGMPQAAFESQRQMLAKPPPQLPAYD